MWRAGATLLSSAHPGHAGAVGGPAQDHLSLVEPLQQLLTTLHHLGRIGALQHPKRLLTHTHTHIHTHTRKHTHFIKTRGGNCVIVSQCDRQNVKIDIKQKTVNENKII